MAQHVRVLLALAAVVCARGASLNQLLMKMDRAAKEFNSYSATAIVIESNKMFHENYRQDGSFRLRRTNTGVSGIIELIGARDQRVIHFNGAELEIYFPKAGESHVYKVGQYASIVDRMLLLGFSVSQDEIKKDYNFYVGGVGLVGQLPSTRLVLHPKSREVLKRIKSIELWFPEAGGYAIRQKITQPDGDYKQTEYVNLEVNPALPDSAFELNVPPGTKRVVEN